MKKTYTAIFLAAALFSGFTSCNDEALQPAADTGRSLIPAFRETYSLTAHDTWGTTLRDSLIIPVEGVTSRQTVDFNADAVNFNDLISIKEGVQYTPLHNPAWYRYWINEYADTCFDAAAAGPVDTKGYAPHPYGITEIKMKIPMQFNPGEFWDMSTSVGYKPYNENYNYDNNSYYDEFREIECTSLFRIRYRSYHAFICNGYSWEGLEQKGPWIEMELTEFNERGGDRLIDMSSIYLIAKEKPTTMYTYNKKRQFQMDVKFSNGKTNYQTKGLSVYSCF